MVAFWLFTVSAALVLTFQNCGQGFMVPYEKENQALRATNSFNVTGFPMGTSSDVDLSITFNTTSFSNGNYVCYLNSQRYTPCVSPMVLRVPYEGTHTFEIVSTDDSVAPYKTTWTTEYPDLKIQTYPISSPTPNTEQFIYYSVKNLEDADVHVDCVIDGAPNTNCPNPISLSGLNDGPHQVQLDLKLDATTLDSVTLDWVVDTTMFELTIVSGPGYTDTPVPGYSNSPEAVFELALLDENGNPKPGSMQCDMHFYSDAGTVTIAQKGNCGYPTHNFGVITEDGRYSGSFYVTDAAGRSYQRYYSFRVDRTPVQDFEVMANDNFATPHSAVFIPVRILDDPDTWRFDTDKLEYRVRGIHSDFVENEYDSDHRVSGYLAVINDLPQGNHTVDFRFRDQFGNISEVKSLSFSIYPEAQRSVYKGHRVSFDYELKALGSNVVGSYSRAALRYVFYPRNTPGEITRLGTLSANFHYWSDSVDSTYRDHSPLSLHHGHVAHSADQIMVFRSHNPERLITVDVSNPMAPVILSVKPVNLRYVAESTPQKSVGLRRMENSTVHEIVEVDFSDPTNPSIRGTGIQFDLREVGLGNGSSFGEFQASDQYAIVDLSSWSTDYSSSQRNVLIYELSGNPLTPQLLGTMTFDTSSPNESISWVRLVEDRIIVVSSLNNTRYLRVYDAATRSQIQDLSSECPYFDATRNLAGNSLFCSQQNQQTNFYTWSGNSYTQQTTLDFRIFGVESESMIYKYDYLDRYLLRHQRSGNNFVPHSQWLKSVGFEDRDGFYIHNNRILAVGLGHIHTYPLEPEAAYTPVNTVSLAHSGGGSHWKDGNSLFVQASRYSSIDTNTSSTTALYHFDITDPDNPVLRGQLDNISARKIISQGNYVYASSSNQLQTIQVAGDGSLSEVNTTTTTRNSALDMKIHNGQKLFIVGTGAAVAEPQTRDFGIAEIDISNPAAPSEITFHSLRDQIGGENAFESPFLIHDNYLITGRYGEMQCFNVSSSANMTYNAQVQGPITLNSGSDPYELKMPKVLTPTPGGPDYWFYPRGFDRRDNSLSFTHPLVPDYDEMYKYLMIFEVDVDSSGNPRVTQSAIRETNPVSLMGLPTSSQYRGNFQYNPANDSFYFGLSSYGLYSLEKSRLLQPVP